MERQFPVGYDEMHILSTHMLAAVERGDWERVAELEKQIAAIRDLLMDHPVPLDASPEAIEEQKRLLSAIILNQQSTASQAQDKLEELRELIDTTSNQRRVGAAYGGDSDSSN
ncbi:MAG: flagellar protein FliT [Sterolibacterium sp.]|nr:flagellar protein FliT [Sterolibacterium sp.]